MALVSRRLWSLSSYAVWAAIVWATALGPALAAGSNILLLIADDFGVDLARFYPLGPRQQTSPPPPPMPNLEALARQGVVFTRVWATPWCSPTRAEILTGRYPFRTGIGRANSGTLPPLSSDEVTLADVVAEAHGAAYLRANLGKWHLSSGENDPAAFGWEHYAGGHPDLGELPSYHNWPKTVNGDTTASTVYATTDTVDETLAVIAWARANGRRYLAWTAFNAPHDPWEPPPADLHPSTPLPATGATNRAVFEAMVEALDTEIGRLLEQVSLADTTVIFIGDNGTTGGVTAAPYPKTKAKSTMYEGGLRVPLIVAGAGVVSPNRRVSALVSAVDLFPTILELAGIAPAAIPPNDGVSLLPYLQARSHPARRSWLYSEQFTTSYDRSWQRAIRTVRYKLIERHDGTREFYDLTKDVFEAKNLLKGSLTSTQRNQMRSLDRQMDALLATR